jgi:nucleotide-binding universal stress UspA family protein
MDPVFPDVASFGARIVGPMPAKQCRRALYLQRTTAECDKKVRISWVRESTMSDLVRAPVVVGIDGSTDDREAVGQGAWQAKRRRAELRLVHVARPLAPRWGPSEILADLHAWDSERSERVLATAAAWARAAEPDIYVRTVSTSGSVAAALLAESRQAALTVVGTHARDGVFGHLSASIACQLAAHADGPVLVVRSATPIHRRPVVVGIDGSAPAAIALDHAVAEAVARRSTVVAVFVWWDGDVQDLGIRRADDVDAAAPCDKALRLLAEFTAGFADRYPEVRIERRIVHDAHPGHALAEIAASLEAGLIVVGGRGNGGFLGLRLGSTADAVIRDADVPVLVIHTQHLGDRPSPEARADVP